MHASNLTSHIAKPCTMHRLLCGRSDRFMPEFSGHLALPIMLGTLCGEGAAELMGEARALYEHHERDAGDTILMAFKAENWTKVTVCPTAPVYWKRYDSARS